MESEFWKTARYVGIALILFMGAAAVVAIIVQKGQPVYESLFPHTERVAVNYPRVWPDGAYLSCVWVQGASLDCSHEENVAPLDFDVRFEGEFRPDGKSGQTVAVTANGTASVFRVTCQRKQSSIACRKS
jgi:hypothetical protein